MADGGTLCWYWLTSDRQSLYCLLVAAAAADRQSLYCLLVAAAAAAAPDSGLYYGGPAYFSIAETSIVGGYKETGTMQVEIGAGNKVS